MPRKGESDSPYRGYLLRWTGYVTSQNNIRMIGQWVTRASDGSLLWAGTNGSCGVTTTTSDFSTAVHDGWEQITIYSTAAAREKMKQAALSLLMLVIDRYIDERKTV